MFYVFFTSKVVELPGFTTKTRSLKGRDGTVESWEEYFFAISPGKSLGLSRQTGRWYCCLTLTEKEVPEVLADVVDEISLIEEIPTKPHRERGIYRHRTAQAEVSDRPTGAARFRVHITGKTLADIRELSHKIKAGLIRPDESYEGTQTGMSRKELEQKLHELEHFLHAANRLAESYERELKAIKEAHTTLDCTLGRVKAFAERFNNGGVFDARWPLCTVRGVWIGLSNILYDRI